MAKQQTKSNRMEDLFTRARLDLPREMFLSWLAYCFGIFETVVEFNRKVKRMDIVAMAMELDNLRKKAGYLPKCIAKGCDKTALSGLTFCADHNLEYRMIGSVEQ